MGSDYIVLKPSGLSKPKQAQEKLAAEVYVCCYALTFSVVMKTS